MLWSLIVFEGHLLIELDSHFHLDSISIDEPNFNYLGKLSIILILGFYLLIVNFLYPIKIIELFILLNGLSSLFIIDFH